MTTAKAAYREVYEDLYERFRIKGAEFDCFYCGAPASTLDHVPPISRVEDYRCMQIKREQYIKVACCTECNSVLGNSLQESLIEREMYLKWRLETRYKRLLRMPVWNNHMLAEMGKNMRSKIMSDMQKKKVIEARIDYSVGINSYIDSLEMQDIFADVLGGNRAGASDVNAETGV